MRARRKEKILTDFRKNLCVMYEAGEQPSWPPGSDHTGWFFYQGGGAGLSLKI